MKERGRAGEGNGERRGWRNREKGKGKGRGERLKDKRRYTKKEIKTGREKERKGPRHATRAYEEAARGRALPRSSSSRYDKGGGRACNTQQQLRHSNHHNRAFMTRARPTPPEWGGREGVGVGWGCTWLARRRWRGEEGEGKERRIGKEGKENREREEYRDKARQIDR